jgi:peptidoglycan-associated lipoprotein
MVKYTTQSSFISEDPMEKRFFCVLSVLAVVLVSLSGCRRSSSDVWEDTKSAGRHMKRGMCALIGTPADSRQIRSRADFECYEDETFPVDQYQDYSFQEGSFSSDYDMQQSDFIPLEDPTHQLASSQQQYPPPRETPGELGSSIPGIEAFRDPNTIPQLAGIFHPIYFSYDSSMIKGEENLQIIHKVADFLRYHPNIYVFIEGHTDERGPQAYNLALGSRRANTIRNVLIQEGIHSDRLFTISYGKERPVILEKHEEGWSKNRRGEFKVYER